MPYFNVSIVGFACLMHWSHSEVLEGGGVVALKRLSHAHPSKALS